MRVRRPELVVAAALLVSSPMVPGVLSGALSTFTVLERLLVALLICWLGGALLTSVLERYSEAARRAEIERAVAAAQAAQAQAAQAEQATPPRLGGGFPGE